MLRKLTLAKAIHKSRTSRLDKSFGLSGRFSTLQRELDKSREVVNRIVAQREGDLENEKFEEFCKRLFQVYRAEEKRKKNNRKRDEEFLVQALTSKFPVKDALKTYKEYQEGYNDEHVSTSLENLAKLVSALHDKPTYYFDLSRKELLENWRFNDLMGDIKYVLMKGVSISEMNLIKIAESLSTMGYKDHEIQAAFIEKIHRLWTNTDDGLEINEIDLHQNPQYGKKGFYPKEGRQEVSLKELLQNPEFKKHIDDLVFYDQATKKETVQSTQSNNPDVQEIDSLLEKLTNTIKKTELAQKQLGLAIIAIRDQFSILNESQKESFIIQNNFLRSELLELEEFLLEAGLLNLRDIRDPKNINDPQLKFENAANILSNLLLEQKETTFDPTVSKFIQSIEDTHQVKNEQTIEVSDLLPNLDKEVFSKCLAALVDIAGSSGELYQSDQCINDKWRELLPNPDLQEYYNPELFFRMDFKFYKLANIYSDIWQRTTSYLKDSYPSINEQLTSEEPSFKKLEASINFAYAYSKVHLSTSVNTFLQNAQTSQGFFSQISKSTFIRLLRAFNYSSTFDKKSFYPLIQAYVKSEFENFTHKEALETVHFLAIHNQHEFPEFNKTLRIANAMVFDNVLTEITDYEKELLNDLHVFFLVQKLKNPNVKGLSSHLESVARTTRMNEMEETKNRMFVDPVKELIQHGLQKTVKEKFSNLLPSSIKSLSQGFQPNLFYRSQDKKIGIFVGGGEVVSMDANELSYVYQYRFRMIETLYPEITCRGISVHQFVDIDYHNANIAFRSNDYLQTILADLDAENKPLKALKKMSIALFNDFDKLLQTGENQKNDFYAFVQQLEQFFFTEKEYSAVLEDEQRANYSDKLKYRLAYLHSSFLKTNPEVQKKINEVAKNDFGKDFYGVLQEFKNSLKQKKSTKTKETPIWAGLIYGEQIPVRDAHCAAAGEKNIDIELLNHPFLWDANYHHYNDWRNLLEGSFNGNNLDTEVLPAPLNYHGNERRVPTGLIPHGSKIRNSIQPLSFPWNWEILSYRVPQPTLKKYLDKEIDNFIFQKPIRSEIQDILNLQNFKIEWKSNLSQAQIANKLVEFDFIEELIAEHLGHQPKTPFEQLQILCHRNPKDYFNYQERLSRSWLLKDQYASFFFNQDFKRQHVHSIKEEFDAKMKKLYKDYVEKNLSVNSYAFMKNRLKKNYLRKLHQVRAGQNDKNEIVSNHVTTLGFDFDFKSLTKATDLENLYNYENDIDYQRSNQDLQDTLDLKRRKAETKLIKLRLIKKIHEGKALSSLETEYLKKWKQSMNDALLVDLDLNMVPKNFTRRSIGSLSESDRKNLKNSDFFDINLINSVGLSDLILELSLFYDERTIARLETQVKGKQVSEEWEISSDYQFDFSENIEVRLVMDSIEENIWRQSGKFNKEEIESLHEMFGVLRGKGQTDRAWYKVDRQSLDEFLELANRYENRGVLLENWFKKKEVELVHKSAVDVPPDLQRPDSFYSKIFKPKFDEKIRKSVEDIFGMDYEQIQRTDLHAFVENILERLYVLKKYIPKKLNYVLKGVLRHPNLAALDKNNLQSALKIQGIELEIVSSKLVAIHNLDVDGETIPEAEEFSRESVGQKLRKAKIAFIPELSKKFQSL